MSAELKKLIADFGKLPKSMRAEIRASAKEIGDPVLQEVRRRASWSSRIPAATRISVRFGARTSGVTVRTSAKKAPHARPYEHGGERGTFRVPVFRQKGRRTPWVDRAARPFFTPGVIAAQDGVADAFRQIVVRVGLKNGWHY
ncbi:HK97 gp10 family phage protein [Planobispora longispora]|uniref:HK97 gp10 family phage protein n=1 Tax=Planobispora longispora TaxID=28887 RepID=A0A8J3RLR6_9ACTN|nr:HK97 gp10 family phage protein [Planobispora longispora]GIH76137.1 hypothetical protein Plo01_25660 [Planobispora longispora]